MEEPDERFWVGVDLTRNEQAIMIALGSKLTSEVWLLDANDPAGEPVVVAPRREGVEYDVEHAGDQLLITHNADAANFSLATAPLDSPGDVDHADPGRRDQPAARRRRLRRPRHPVPPPRRAHRVGDHAPYAGRLR